MYVQNNICAETHTLKICKIKRNEAEDNDESHSGGNLQKITAVPLSPPFVALPPPPPPPSFVDPTKPPSNNGTKSEEKDSSNNNNGSSGQDSEGSKVAGSGKRKGGGGGGGKDKGGAPGPEGSESLDSKPKKEVVIRPPEMYKRDETLVARCFFMQGAEEGGVGRRDTGVERMRLHMSAFGIWRPASNGNNILRGERESCWITKLCVLCSCSYALSLSL
jgi:hypothetical protein